MTSWFWRSKQQEHVHLEDGDKRFTHLGDAGPDNGTFRLIEVRPRPDSADRGGSRIVALPEGYYESIPQLAKGLKMCDLSYEAIDSQGKRAIDFGVDIISDAGASSTVGSVFQALGVLSKSTKRLTMRPLIEARYSKEDATLLHDAEMVWMELKQGAKDCVLFTTTFDMSKAQSQLSLEFTTPWDTEVEVVCWVQDFRFGTEGGESYSCDFWASNITANGFTANATASKNAERLTVNWIVYKKDKSKVASGSFGTEDIEDREEETPENSGRVDFAEGAFDTTPTVLAALSQFDLEGGKDLRVAVEIEDISTSGFTWHLNTWGEGSTHALRSAEASYVALGFV